MVEPVPARHRELEARLLQHAHILDCVVVARPSADGRTSLVAYVVPHGYADIARLKQRIEAEALAARQPVLPVLVDQIPRDATGVPALAALLALPTITPGLLQRYEQLLLEQPQAGRLQVGLSSPTPEPGRIHISAIDPDWQPVVAEPAAATAEQPAADQTEHQALPPALCAGEPIVVAPDEPRTLPAALLRAAEQFPGAGVQIVLDRQRTRLIDYPALLTRARRILGGLRASGLRAGDVAILQSPSLEDHFPTFWACMLGGIRPVSIARPPSYQTRNAVLDKLFHAWETLERPVLISGGQTVVALRSLPELYEMAGLRVLDLAQCEQAAPAEELHQPDPTDVAMFQLSSGSTGKSKVIQITHRGLMEFVIGDCALTDFAPGDVMFNWLSLDHVVPIVMFHLRGVFRGCTHLHAPAELVLGDPLLWLDLLERHQVNHTWAPNFGYKLITEALQRQPQRHWDLSALRTLLNAGEQCTLPVMSEFVRATEPFGITARKLVLAWGMAETCTAIVYKRFSDADSVHAIRKSSISGQLQWLPLDADPADQTIFLSMGYPAPGAELRVVDHLNQLVSEGRIGRLQVRSQRVTPGYLNNPAANSEAFPDGAWFNTGDLAFIKDGQITITGREKELIIVGGNHYYCYDIEDVVSAIDGVLPSFVGAVGVPTAQTGSEALVVFFVPEQPATSSPELLREIRRRLATHFQLAPALVVPIPEEQFPKTTSGKIQRTALRQRLMQGEFNSILTALDLREANRNTLPDAVYRAEWQPTEAIPLTALPLPGLTLLVLDDHGLGDNLSTRSDLLEATLRVRPAAEYIQRSDDYVELDTTQQAHWERLFQTLQSQGRVPQTLLYLASYLQPPAQPDSDPRPAMAHSGAALLALCRAFVLRCEAAPLTLITVSRQLHRITCDEAVCYPAALTPAIAAGVRHEWPQIDSWHLDLPGVPLHEEAEALGQLLQMHRSAPEVAWRAGRPYVRRLVKARLTQTQQPAALLTPGACYLVTGGLGGVGLELLSELLPRVELNILIIGRTPLDQDDSFAGDRLAQLSRLARSGTISYRAVDLHDAAALELAVQEAEARWQRPLDGVLHLAGSYDMRLLADEDAASWQHAIGSKTIGSVNLARLLRDRPAAELIAFSSLLTLSGATGMTAYSAANRFLESFCEHLAAQRTNPVRCLIWGLWHGIGMNRNNLYQDHVGRHGILSLSAADGRGLARAVLSQPPGQYLIGVDAAAVAMRRWVRGVQPRMLEVPTISWLPDQADAPPPALPPLHDSFGQPVEPILAAPAAASPTPAAPAPPREPATPTRPASAAIDRAGLRQRVLALFRDALPGGLDEQRPFYELGLGSIQVLQIHTRLQQALGLELPQTTLFQHPTIDALTEFLASEIAPAQHTASTPSQPSAVDRADRRVAIIGIAGRFPGAETLDAFWHNLALGTSSIRRFSPAELAAAGIPAAVYNQPDFVPVTGALNDVDTFDAEFFGISAREAALIEPQQRLFLECAYHALEHGGYAAADDATEIGVFAGTGMTLYALQTYLLNNLGTVTEPDDPVTALQVAIGNQPDFVATRVAYRLGLTGPAINVQTACSTSLVALHLACQSLIEGDCDLALAGAAAIHVPQASGYRYRDGSILSQTGVCRTFDAEADGTVGGNGVGVVLLKRLDRAIQDGDTIHAVILGSAVNNDGATKVGYTAPSVAGQARVIERALENAAIPADSIGYIEAHGTGTRLGDPIEFQALRAALGRRTSGSGTWSLGSVKPNIGHLDTCAGMAGLSKVVLMLQHQQIPPLINFRAPNPDLKLQDSPFSIPTELQPWPAGDTPRRAGISALGVGGTNAHVIVEEAPARVATAPRGPVPGLLPLSAHSAEALRAMAAEYRDHLRQHPAISVADLFVSATLGRRHLRQRLAVLGQTPAALADALDAYLAAPRAAASSTSPFVAGELPRDTTGSLALLFSGQGAQSYGMARPLYERFAVFRDVLDRCERYQRDVWGESLLDLLLRWPADAPEPTTDRVQPALFAFQVALASLWQAWDVTPASVVGHSVGEYAAFCVAGALSLEDGLHLTTLRGRLMQARTAPGGMVVVFADRAAVDRLLAAMPQLELAVVNSERNHVLTGPEASIERLTQQLETQQIEWQRLPVTRAFHSALLEPMLAELRQHLEQLRFQPLTIPLASNLDGALLPVGTIPDAEYFYRQTRQTARFDLALARLVETDSRCFIEIGPDATLTKLGRRQQPELAWIPSQQRKADPVETFFRAVGSLYCQGVPLDWRAQAQATGGGRIPLPTYPFQRKSYWISTPTEAPHTPKPAPVVAPPLPTISAPAPVVAPLLPAISAPAPVVVQAARLEPQPASAYEPGATAMPQLAPVPANDRDPVLEHILDRVREMTARQLGQSAQEIRPDDLFFDLGADSLLMINMLRELEKLFGVRIAMRELFEEGDSPLQLSQIIQARLSPERTQSLLAAVTPAPVSAPATTASAPATPPPALLAQPPAPPSNGHVPVTAAQPTSRPLPAAPTPPASAVIPASQPASGHAATNGAAIPTPQPASSHAATNGAAPLAPVASSFAPVASADGSAQGVVSQQLQLIGQFSQLMSQQLAFLSGQPAPAVQPTLSTAVPVASAAPASTDAHSLSHTALPVNNGHDPSHTAPPAQSGATPAPAPSEVALLGPRVSVSHTSGMASGKLSAQQQAHFEQLVRQYVAKTGGSRAITQQHRRVLADSRAVVGFRSSIKEMLYPIAGRHGKGSRLEDVDGNQYVDITMGFGVLLFGHEPEFVTEAVREHLARGVQLGPRSQETGEAAQLLSELTGMERVAFSNSGTEANSGAIRLARAFTGRNKLVMFNGSYHGHFDNVLGRTIGEGAQRETIPVSSGIPQSAVAEITVLDYGDPASLQVIEELGDDLAAVLVEPVQSRHPSRQPAEFVRALRELTARRGIVLLFDEMLTGFRPAPRGAQDFFGVTPDLATYGKVLGGGFPIGAIAGRAEIMDGIDGGYWQYGDDSTPPRETTFFGGTYIQHPVSMAAALAVLRYLKTHSPQLQQQLNARTDYLAQTLNRFFEEEEFPVRISHFGSLFRFEYRSSMELLFYHLLLNGVYVWEWRNFFLSTAHSDADIEFVIGAVKKSLRDMRAGGFFASGRTTIAAPAVPGGSIAVLSPPAASVPPTAPPAAPAPVVSPTTSQRRPATPDFSLYFFGDYPQDGAQPSAYQAILESARFADQHGFHAVWVPERHFHSFGGVFPNPAVLAAALARETQRIRIHAGSVVLPLHHPIRVAEEWSMIDNLSGGRIGLGCASGWHANDFVFYPEHFGRHKALMYEQIATIRRLWRGEAISARSGSGDEIAVTLHPRPVQAMPPFFTAIVGNPESYQQAAQHDLGVITNLMSQTVEQLADNIALYRQSRAAQGLDREGGKVVVLLHTYLGADVERVQAEAFGPFCSYLRSSLSLFGQFSNSLGFNIDLASTSEEDLQYILGRAYERYCESRALIGTPESCAPIIDRLLAIGVDEIACFIDFGMSQEQIRTSLPLIDTLRQRYQSADALPATQPPDQTTAPLALAQQRIWFLDQLFPGRTTYNEPKVIRLDGPLDVPALRAALGQLVERHAALRTVFRAVDGEPHQVILPYEGVDCPVLECAGQDETATVREAMDQEGRRLFDLQHGPLFQPRLLRFSPTRHVLVLSMHHIVFDTWSAFVFTRELPVCYRAWRDGHAAPLPPLTMSYADYARQQHAALGSSKMQQELQFWLSQLGQHPPALELPTDHPRPAVSSASGRAFFQKFSPELSDALRQFSRRQRVTLFMTLLSGFAAMLHRFSGQQDFVIGTPVASRPEGTEELVGFFVNTLALRMDLAGDPSFGELLRRVRATTLEAYEHQELPFEELVKAINPARDTSRNPIFQVAIEFENEAIFEFELPDVQATLLDVAVDKAPFDLMLYLANLPDGIQCHVEYSTDLFEERTVQRFLDTFRQVLELAVQQPDTPLSLLAPLTDADRQQLVEWNATATPYPTDLYVHQLVERQAAQTPDAVALVAGEQQLSYAELNRRANQLAHYLRGLGVGPETSVALYMERSIELMVGVLAVLKAGAAYAPLDPASPPERVAFMIADAHAPVLLTQQRQMERLPAHRAYTLCLDRDWGRIASSPVENLSIPIDPANPAYVIYTSGSTGQPKGVAMTQGALLNLLAWQAQQFAATPARTLQLASISFDVAFQELFSTWQGGGAVVLIPEELRADMPGLLRFLADAAISRLFLPFVSLHYLAEVAARAAQPLPALREIITAGEQLQITPAIAAWLGGMPHATLTNQYGPSETHVVTAHTLPGAPTSWPALPSIGRPIANTQIYLLDDELRPVPVGVTGEVYIGGAALARGYLNRPALTAEHFVPHPFSNLEGQQPGARLYRTGDLARYNPDGSLDFQGRADFQVKIRGYRIELGEIETALSRQPAVRATVVQARRDPGVDPYLAAYVVRADSAPTDDARLRALLIEALGRTLPPYMVPRVWVFLLELPLNANGKVDRQRLPAPALNNDQRAAQPLSELEQKLHELWCAELGLTRIAADSRFFDLGGHSLNITRLLNRVRDALGIDYSMFAFFQAPTIRDMAAEIEGKQKSSSAWRRTSSLKMVP